MPATLLIGLVLKQMWDGTGIAFIPQSALDFVGDDGRFPLKFTKARDGKVTHALDTGRVFYRALEFRILGTPGIAFAG